MFSKKNMLAASLMLCLDDVLDEEQVISIFGDLTRKNPPFPYWKFETIDVQLSDMSEAEVRAETFLASTSNCNNDTNFKIKRIKTLPCKKKYLKVFPDLSSLSFSR